jgi:hypothetical protein
MRVARASTIALAWQPISAGAGAKGHRRYDWALIDIRSGRTPGHRWRLIGRNRRTGERAYYRCYARHPVPLATIVPVAGQRWTIEKIFQTGKGLAGLDQHQVRRWTSWHRWATLAMLAHASSPSQPPPTAPEHRHPTARSR